MKSIKIIISIMLSVTILFLETAFPVWAEENTATETIEEIPETVLNVEEQNKSDSVVVDDTEELLSNSVETMQIDDDASIVDQEPAALATDPLGLSVAYPSDIMCGVPVTFTMNATGGSGNYQYRIGGLMVFDGSEWVSVYDISYGTNGSYKESNEFTFTFYASGTYYIRFSVFDMVTHETINTGLFDYELVIQDANYPSVEQIVDIVAAQCQTECSTDFEKALWLHDWIIDHADYDYSYSYSSAEGVLARGEGTCESYHRAYVMLLNKVGIETGRITGNGHVWTAVKMDGEWYQVDSTWDDMGANFKDTYYEHMYFGLTDYIIGLVHTDHTGAVPGYESTALENNYFIKTGEITQWSDPFTDTIRQNLADGKAEFTLPVTSSMPDSYKDVIYNLVAYQLSQEDWDDTELSVSYADNQLTCKVVNARADISVKENSTQTTYTITATNVVISGGVKSVRFAVWSKAGGQDDLIWYTGTRNANGNYVVNVPISNHKTEGAYYVDAYVVKNNDTTEYIGGTKFQVNEISADSIEIEKLDNEKGQFDVRVKGISSVSGIKQIQVAMWSRSDQSNLHWYTAVRQSDGSYLVHADIANHGYAYANYMLDVYATAGNGIQKYLGGKTLQITPPKTTITATTNQQETNCTISITNLRMSGAIQKVSIAVWSAAGGQDDLVWYTAGAAGATEWRVNVPITNHKTAGLYYADAYVTDASGQMVHIGTAKFNVSSPAIEKIEIRNKNEGTGRFDVVLKGLSAKSGLSRVQVVAWSRSNQSDLHWYTATIQSDGSYIVHADIANHNYNYGSYYVDAYVVTGNGITQCMASTRVTMNQPKAIIKAVGNSTETNYTLSVSNAGIAGGIRSLSFAVWSKTGGQDDLKWYTASNSSSGMWVADVSISNHKSAGLYYVDTYATNMSGKTVYMGGITFNVSTPSASSVKITNKNEGTGRFDVEVKGIVARAGVNTISVAVWSRADQSDLHWYTATRQSDQNYVVNASISNHNYNYGKYYVDAYVTAGNGVGQCVGSTTVKMNVPKAVITANGNATQTKYAITASSVGMAGGVNTIQFAIWSAEGGQDDLIWYTATNTTPGTWTVNMTVANHKSTGIYYVDAYGQSSVGTSAYLGGTTFKVDGSAERSVEFSNCQ